MRLPSIISAIIVLGCFHNNAHSGKIFVINETKKTIHFRLIPEPEHNNLFRKKYGKLKVKRNSTREFLVEPHHVKGQPVYSIEGEKSFGGDTCINMDIHKDYRIIFKKEKIGMTCIAEEIDSSSGAEADSKAKNKSESKMGSESEAEHNEI